jgi:protein phosphatase
VPEEDIEQIINAAATPELACQHLVEAANHAGGADNIAVILVRLSK